MGDCRTLFFTLTVEKHCVTSLLACKTRENHLPDTLAFKVTIDKYTIIVTVWGKKLKVLIKKEISSSARTLHHVCALDLLQLTIINSSYLLFLKKKVEASPCHVNQNLTVLLRCLPTSFFHTKEHNKIKSNHRIILIGKDLQEDQLQLFSKSTRSEAKPCHSTPHLCFFLTLPGMRI